MLSFLQNTLSSYYDYCVNTGDQNPVEQQIANLPYEIQYHIAQQLEKQLLLGLNKNINANAEKHYIKELVALLNEKSPQYSETDFSTDENRDQFYQEQKRQFNDKKGILFDIKDHPCDLILSYFFGYDHFAKLPSGKASAQLLKRQVAINKLDESIEQARKMWLDP